MPRQPRLDAPGLLQHVMARRIERRKIFWDDKDRSSFLERLALILDETQTQCYAWALIPNHFHLLLRTGQTPLSKVMRRLMTGYAVTFNKRHKRSGHLFQNRYKSIVCEEDPYLLELIRYIHLNPLRAGLVKDLKELDRYPWTGHSAILGKRKNPLVPCPSPKNKQEKSEKYLAEKTIEDVLLHLGDTLKVARRRYRQFVKNGIEQGTRPTGWWIG
ncbi:MAG: transposase [Deltaproteobacteria bacterium]|nr:transposase [Deltaproteobacteria bacterium]